MLILDIDCSSNKTAPPTKRLIAFFLFLRRISCLIFSCTGGRASARRSSKQRRDPLPTISSLYRHIFSPLLHERARPSQRRSDECGGGLKMKAQDGVLNKRISGWRCAPSSTPLAKSFVSRAHDKRLFLFGARARLL